MSAATRMRVAAPIDRGCLTRLLRGHRVVVVPSTRCPYWLLPNVVILPLLHADIAVVCR